MEKPNFSDVYAQLDWADRQIDIIAHEIRAFVKSEPYKLTREPHENGTHDAIYLEVTADLPQSLTPPVATAIQSQRSALDYIAVALAKRNGAENLTDTYFPVGKSKDAMADKLILKKVRRLSSADQERIFDLKPYPGGNDFLYALHWLNSESKHRRLNVIGSVAGPHSISGPGMISEVVYFSPVLGANERGVIALTPPETNCQLNFSLDITFREIAGNQPRIAVVPLLHQFSTMCRDIAQTFESTP